jgi:carotenoid cleavage dioxygenase-like enzyme
MTTTAPANPFLAGNYGPVADEVTLTDLEVRGRLPEALTGRYLRTGPNPYGTPAPPYHWFVGDGMIHGIELDGGRATSYRNRWVRTDDIAAKLGEQGVDGPAQPMYDASNTNVVGFAGRILSLTEGCHPYEMSRELDTLRRFTPKSGELPHGLTAHPKIDPVTGDLHAFSYWFVEPFLYYHVIRPDGTVAVSEPITLPRSVSMHDFAITRDHVLFFDQPYVFDLDIATQQGFPFRWAPEHGARLGVMPRTGTDADIRWFETETCYTFHPMNAYDVVDADGAKSIVVDVPKMDRVGAGPGPLPNNLALERWTVDLNAGVVKQTVLDDTPQEFCRVNESRLASRHRFGYTIGTGMGADAMPYASTRVFKHDFDADTRVDHDFGHGRHPGELVFVADPDRTTDEDGGWCMGLVHDDASERSSLVVLDAQDYAAGPVAEVMLPRRVPYGFHGNWIPNRVA